MKEEASAATSSKDDDATHPSKIALDRQIVYARKRTPEQRHRDKQDQFRDESEEELQYKPPKKKTLREVALEAQTAHKEMCTEAMANMAKIQNIMTKLDRKLDEMK